MAVTSPPKLDARKLRADFPIFEQEIHGKPLAYLDSAVSTHKPRQVLDEADATSTRPRTRTCTAVCTRCPSARRPSTRARARRSRTSSTRLPTREIVFVRGATEGAEPRRVRLGARQPRPGRPRRRHRARAPLELRALAVHREADRRDAAHDRARRQRRARPVRARRDRRARATSRSSRTTSSRTRSGRSTRSRSSRPGRTSRARSWSSTGRRRRRTRRIDVQALGCDFFAFSAHKMCGPTSVGALWGRLELLESMEPFNLGGHMIRKVTLEETTWGEVPAKYEAGTQPIAEAVGFGAAVDYVNDGRARVDRAPRARAAVYALEKLGDVPDIKLYGPPADRRAGIVSFNLGDIHPHDVAQVLDHGRRGDPRGAPLLPAADAEARRGGDEPRELLPVHAAGGDRPARGRPAQGPKSLRLGYAQGRERLLPRGHPRPLQEPARARGDGGSRRPGRGA